MAATTSPAVLLVGHFPDGAAPRTVRALREDEVAVLVRVCTEAGGEILPDDARCVGGLLAEAHRGRLWFACGCTCSTQRPPVMYPQRTRVGTLMLVRNFARASHRGGCPFQKLRELEPSAPPKPPQARPDRDFVVLRAARDLPAKIPGAEEHAPARVREPAPSKLARVLFRVLEGAGVAEVPETGIEENAAVAYGQLRAFLSGEALGRDGNVALGDVVAFGPAGVAPIGRSIADPARAWPKGAVPQGFVVMVAWDIAGAELVASRGRKLPVEGSIQRYGARTEPPYLAIVAVGHGQGGRVAGLRAYLHPLYSPRGLLLVDSGLERETLKRLLHLQQWLREKFELRFRIVKPLLTPSWAPDARPDFVLDAGGLGRVCVETMGGESPEYLERKRGTHAFMAARIGPVVKHEPGSKERDREFLRSASRALLDRLRGARRTGATGQGAAESGAPG